MYVLVFGHSWLRTHARTHIHTHARNTHTHTRARARAHTHRGTEGVVLIDKPHFQRHANRRVTDLNGKADGKADGNSGVSISLHLIYFSINIGPMSFSINIGFCIDFSILALFWPYFGPV